MGWMFLVCKEERSRRRRQRWRAMYFGFFELGEAQRFVVVVNALGGRIGGTFPSIW